MKVELHQFACDWDLPNPSPFCMKVETYLRIRHIPYTVVPWSPTRAPLGKAPFIVLDGQPIADSTCIVRTLEQHVDPAPPSPADEHTAHGHALVRMLEEHTYFCLMRLRWLDDDAWSTYRHVIGAVFPSALRRPLTWWLRRDVRRVLHAQGIGRHSVDEVALRLRQDLVAVERSIRGPYLHGEQLHPQDATVYAFLEGCRHPLGMAAVADLYRPGSRLREYTDTIRQTVWADWPFLD